MVTEVLLDLKRQYDAALPSADPRTQDWLLLQRNPLYVWGLTILYLLFVWLGPKYMRNRQPYSFQLLMFIYNLSLVALSVYMFVEIIISTYDAGYNFWCAKYNMASRVDPTEIRVANVMWWYFFSKAIELNDTVLMVLRKKNNQISFLHVFHHATMLNIWWWVMMFIPGGLSIYGSGLNCLVHVVMYSYYGLSVIPALKGKLWWKKYITRFQLIQFCCTLTHTLNSLRVGCDFPLWGQNLLGGYMILMLILFTNFYIHTYYMSRKKAKHESHSNGIQEKNGSVPASNGLSKTNKKKQY